MVGTQKKSNAVNEEWGDSNTSAKVHTLAVGPNGTTLAPLTLGTLDNPQNDLKALSEDKVTVTTIIKAMKLIIDKKDEQINNLKAKNNHLKK